MEPTRVCKDCELRKPWSQFHVKKRWEDGTPRQVQSYCKPCANARKVRWAQSNREKHNAANRAFRARAWADPIRRQHHLAVQRERHTAWRRRQGMEPRFKTTPGTAQRLPIAAFKAWLQETFSDPGEASRITGLDDSAMNRYYHGRQPLVSIDTVDRACLAVGARLDDVYPDD